MQLTDQKKGTLLAFTAIMFITPDSLFIRLSTIESWNLIFYRGFIPFFVVFIGLLIIQKGKIITALINNGWHGIAYVIIFTITNILFVISIENTSVANTLIMISLAPMLSAILSLIFLKENPDKKTWIAIIITTLAVIYIFFDAFEKGDIKGNFFGLVCATGLAAGAVIIRSVKQLNLVPSAMMGKLLVAIIALLFADNLNLKGSDSIIIPTMCIMCVAIPFVLVCLETRGHIRKVACRRTKRAWRKLSRRRGTGRPHSGNGTLVLLPAFSRPIMGSMNTSGCCTAMT